MTLQFRARGKPAAALSPEQQLKLILNQPAD
jgi:hypothetical protein